MQGMISRVQRFLTSEDGPTAVEYAVMLALILVACISIVTSLGTSIKSTFTFVNTSLSAANAS
jgi:pilus assembly protein Flp/PilA